MNDDGCSSLLIPTMGCGVVPTNWFSLPGVLALGLLCRLRIGYGSGLELGRDASSSSKCSERSVFFRVSAMGAGWWYEGMLSDPFFAMVVFTQVLGKRRAAITQLEAECKVATNQEHNRRAPPPPPPQTKDARVYGLTTAAMHGMSPPSLSQLETVQMAAAKNILGCSSTTSNTVLRARLGMYPLETNRGVRKLKWQYQVRNIPGKRLPAKADMAVCEKTTKGRAG